MLDWHRIFGTMMLDRCIHTTVDVFLELDVSRAQQFLDCALLKKPIDAPEPELPDGFSPLLEHNLISFKSMHEAVNPLAIEELLGAAISYRKENRSTNGELLPEEKVQRMLVATRSPQLERDEVLLTRVSPGVYNMRYGMSKLRLVVIRELPTTPRNSPLLFFSGVPELVAYARSVFQPRTEQLSTSVLNEVLVTYGLEGFTMPFTAEDFMREHTRNVIERASVEERLRGLPPEARLQGLPAEARLQGLPAEARLQGLPPEARLQGLPPETRLQGLSTEELRQLKVLLEKL